jgi:tRNA-splicing ligase RtcB (3'-phosphate/5'-hydroxy nucleic acid ligase)
LAFYQKEDEMRSVWPEPIDGSTTGPLPIFSWIPKDEVDPGAAKQARNLAELPFAFHHIALMPDVHMGYGMPIGGVLATTDVVVPNAVGVDIGCGMCAIDTGLDTISTDDLKLIMGRIRNTIPVGFSHHGVDQDEKWVQGYEPLPVVSKNAESALRQVGTLGGGNHFIEIQRGRVMVSSKFGPREKTSIWIMIHSGSRNLGLKVAEHYNWVAAESNRKWYSAVPRGHDLAFLPISALPSMDGMLYLDEMDFCVRFAFNNRILMMIRILDAFEEVLRGFVRPSLCDMYNIAHNYVAQENHYG